MTAGYSGTPLPRKLGIKEGHAVASLGAPDGFRALLDPFPEDVRFAADPEDAGAYDVIVAFVRSGEDLDRRFARGLELLDPHGGLWMAWPKRSSPLATELREGDVRERGLSTGLVDNKICAIDDDWSGLRFVVRVRDRPRK